MRPNYSVNWTVATGHGNLTLTVAEDTYFKRQVPQTFCLQSETINAG